MKLILAPSGVIGVGESMADQRGQVTINRHHIHHPSDLWSLELRQGPFFSVNQGWWVALVVDFKVV